nr:MAG TPA: hypothetical protein [Caudoviricetes sp.]
MVIEALRTILRAFFCPFPGMGIVSYSQYDNRYLYSK